MATRNAVIRNAVLLVFLPLVSTNCSRTGNNQSVGTSAAGLDPDFTRELLSIDFTNDSDYYVHINVSPAVNRGNSDTDRKWADPFKVMVPPKNVSGGKASIYLPRHTTIPDGYKIFLVNLETEDQRARRDAPELCDQGKGIRVKVGWSNEAADRPTNVEGQFYTRTVGGITVAVRPPPADEVGLTAKAKTELGKRAIRTVTWESGTDGLKFTRNCIATAGTVPHFVSGSITCGDASIDYGPGDTIRSLTISGGGRNIKIQCGEEPIPGQQLLATLDGTSFAQPTNNETEEPLDPGSGFNAWLTNDGENMAPDTNDAQVCTADSDLCGCQASEF